MNFKAFVRVLPWICLFGVAPAQENPTEEQTFYIAQFAHGQNFETVVNLLNLSDLTNRVEVRTFDDTGNPSELLLRKASPFEPQETAVAAVGEEMAGLGSAVIRSFSNNPATLQVGWAEVTSSGPVAVEVQFSVRNADGTLATSTSVLPTPSTTAASFLAVSLSGGGGTSDSTGVALLNPAGNGQAASITLELLNRLGSPVGERILTLEAGEKIARFIDQQEMFPEIASQEFRGSIEVRSDLPVVVLPLRQEGIHLTTQLVHASRDIQ